VTIHDLTCPACHTKRLADGTPCDSCAPDARIRFFPHWHWSSSGRDALVINLPCSYCDGFAQVHTSTGVVYCPGCLGRGTVSSSWPPLRRG